VGRWLPVGEGHPEKSSLGITRIPSRHLPTCHCKRPCLLVARSLRRNIHYLPGRYRYGALIAVAFFSKYPCPFSIFVIRSSRPCSTVLPVTVSPVKAIPYSLIELLVLMAVFVPVTKRVLRKVAFLPRSPPRHFSLYFDKREFPAPLQRLRRFLPRSLVASGGPLHVPLRKHTPSGSGGFS